MKVWSCFSEIREKLFLNYLAWLWAISKKSIQEKGIQSTQFSVQRVQKQWPLANLRKITFILFGCHRSIQKQPPRGVLSKRCSENMQQIYRRTPIPKCDFNKVAEIALRHGCSPVNLLHTSRTPFSKNTSGRLLLPIAKSIFISHCYHQGAHDNKEFN